MLWEFGNIWPFVQRSVTMSQICEFDLLPGAESSTFLLHFTLCSFPVDALCLIIVRVGIDLFHWWYWSVCLNWIVLDCVCWMLIRVIDVSKCPTSAVSLKGLTRIHAILTRMSASQKTYLYMSVCFLTERQSDRHVSQLSLICCCSPQEANRHLFIWIDVWQLDPKW